MVSLIVSLVLAQEPSSVLVGDNPKEPHLKNVRQLTFGGQNAEAYWSKDGKQITFQTRQEQWPDEQIMTMNADGSGKKLISTGFGRCTCSYFTPDMRWVYFSSTHDKNKGAQEPVDFSKGYTWMVNPQFSMYKSKPDGSGLTRVVDKNAYVAETTIDPNGKYMVWTSDFEGDLEIYRSDMDGKHIKRLTHNIGYDGGPFVSWDGKQIVYRRYTLKTPQEIEDYRKLLKEHLVRPTKLEIWIMSADGSHQRQVTDLNCASFAPFLSPDNRWIIFSSNFGDKHGREFEIWRVRLDGTGLDRVTNSPDFDGFPMFTRDGKHLVFASNRNGKAPHETNIFVADWVE